MFFREDHTFREIQERSVMDWLNQIENHDDLLVRGGVKATREYIDSLRKQIQVLEEKGRMKDQFLKKLKNDKRELLEKRNV